MQVFMDTGDVTVTVDPIRREHWVYDGYNKFDQSQERGLTYDKVAFQRALNWENADHGVPSLFMPTTRQLDMALKFPSKPEDCPGKHGYGSRNGQLPIVTQQLYEGMLLNKSTGVIEHEMREAARRESVRLYDKSGYTR
jgi:hypothetical protein